MTGHFSPHLTPFSLLGKGELPSKIIGQRQLSFLDICKGTPFIPSNKIVVGEHQEVHLLVDCRKETYTDGLVKRKLSEKCKNGRQIMVSGMVSSSKKEEKVKEKHEKV